MTAQMNTPAQPAASAPPAAAVSQPFQAQSAPVPPRQGVGAGLRFTDWALL